MGKMFDTKELVLGALRQVLGKNMPVVQKISEELKAEFFPELKGPVYKIVDQLRSTWLGRAEGSWHRDSGELVKTIVKIQKSVLDDEETLRRIIAHELVHCWQYQEVPWREIRGDDGHGKFFQEHATIINQKLGQDFVTKTSDDRSVISQTRAYYLLIRPWRGGFAANSFMRPTSRNKEQIAKIIREHEGHVVKIKDMAFVDAATLSSRKISVYKDEKLAKLKELYEGANDDDKFL